LDALGEHKVEFPHCTASIQRGTRAIAHIDERELPDRFWRVSRTIDRAAILAEEKAGRPVPGVTMGNTVPNLMLRTK
jgi:phage host-nuclease inhibitor protein Gam